MLLYYDRQTAVEPYFSLFDCDRRADLRDTLAGAVFEVVWLYDYSGCAVVGRPTVRDGMLDMVFDARYEAEYNMHRTFLAHQSSV